MFDGQLIRSNLCLSCCYVFFQLSATPRGGGLLPSTGVILVPISKEAARKDGSSSLMASDFLRHAAGCRCLWRWNDACVLARISWKTPAFCRSNMPQTQSMASAGRLIFRALEDCFFIVSDVSSSCRRAHLQAGGRRFLHPDSSGGPGLSAFDTNLRVQSKYRNTV